MSFIDNILEKTGLKYEDLSSAERETLIQWTTMLDNNQLTVEKIRFFVKSLRDSIENELIDEPEFIRVLFFKVLNRKQILLKARLKNIILFDSLLTSPERAKKSMESQVASLVSNIK